MFPSVDSSEGRSSWLLSTTPSHVPTETLTAEPLVKIYVRNMPTKTPQPDLQPRLVYALYPTSSSTSTATSGRCTTANALGHRTTKLPKFRRWDHLNCLRSSPSNTRWMCLLNATMPAFEVDVLISPEMINDNDNAEGNYVHACVPVNNGRHIYQVKGNERPHVKHWTVLP
ncbi:hypothetical protein AB1N83_007705 [Pleurotus pulmonarius]